jgi:hypothetical protein
MKTCLFLAMSLLVSGCADATPAAAHPAEPVDQPAAVAPLPTVPTSTDDVLLPLSLTNPIPSGAPISIDAVRRRGTVLEVDVSHAGGCGRHEYSLHWTGEIRETFPSRATVFLLHLDPDNDPCEAMLHRTLRFDVSSIGGTPDTRMIGIAVAGHPRS